MHKMKKLSLIFLVLFSIFFNLNAQIKDPVLLTFENEHITRSEFLKIFNKNNIKGEPITKKAIEEYLELFINFKLKVKEAEALGLDTVKTFINELEGYRMQLAQPYFVDKKVDSALMAEAYERLLLDLRASHILIKVEPYATPEDTLEKYNQIMELRKRVLKGESFEKVAKEASEDLSAQDQPATENHPAIKGNAGDLGYFTAFDLVYPFESAAYNLKIGEVSMPVRSNFGYHIIKLYDKKKAMGKVQVAHILISIPASSTKMDSLKLKAKTDSLYNAIINGADFDEIAKTFSDDKGSASSGGVLPWFGAFRMVPEFIESISKLKNKGDMPEPVLTAYGWHIIKLVDKKEVGSYQDELADIKARFQRDSRSDLSRQSIINKIKKQYNFTEDKASLIDFYSVVTDSIFKGKWDPKEAEGLNKVMFTIGNKTYTQKDFTQLLSKKQSGIRPQSLTSFINYTYDNWVNEECINYKDKNLENIDPEFKSIMKEYRDGILLFDLTDQKVWSKAVKDTVGLKAFYELHKHKHIWKERIAASIYTCADEKVAKATKKLVKKAAKKAYTNDSIAKTINSTSSALLEIKSGKFQKGENDIIDKIAWKKGITKNMKINDKVIFVKITKVLPSQAKELKEIKGIMTAEYQKQLDEEWIKELRNKYKFTVDTNVLNSISVN